MARAYGTARELLDDIVALADLTLARAQPAADDSSAKALAVLDVEAVALGELIDARIAATSDLDRVPLEKLVDTFQLTPTERRCLWLLVAMEVSSSVRARIAPGVATLELLDRLVYGDRAVRDRFASELGPRGRLWTYSLIEWADATSASGRLFRPLRVVERVIELALGSSALADDVAAIVTLELEPPAAGDLVLADGLHEAVVAALRGPAAPVPVIRGPEGSGRRSLALGAAHAIGARAMLVRCDELPSDVELISFVAALQREALLFGAVTILVRAEQLAAQPERELPDRTMVIDRLFAGYPGPVIATASRELVVPLFETRGTIPIDLDVLAEAGRERLWSRELGTEGADLSAAAAARYRVTGGTIVRAARIAREHTRLHGEALSLDAVRAGMRGAIHDRLSGLGVRIEWQQSWDDLVLPDESHDELREMIARVRHRRTVLDDWGFARKVARGLGLPVLFYGPPGTGKTMAAGLVAAELGLDLYQIELSRMVSKYVGETEKQLAQVFDAAEAGHAILLFDEADSLFAKRTEVRSSTDRYANLEVNYLLQRMEAFSGITILTTNLDTAIDEAFRRRLAFRIAFPLPDTEERERLWRRMIPTAACLANDVDFVELAERFAMSGGYIRNAALRAAYLAAADGTTIEKRHLLGAASLEYASMGKVIATASLGAVGARR